MSHDEMGLGIENTLNIIAYMPAVLCTCRHCPGIGICERDLPVGRIVERRIQCHEALSLLPDAVIPARQMGGAFRVCCTGFLAVNPVATDDLAFGEVPVPIVHRFASESMVQISAILAGLAIVSFWLYRMAPILRGTSGSSAERLGAAHASIRPPGT
ncbi:MAG: hypothetical protein H7317_07940, partial [Pseudorhodobacter sp.]|nr:hypothetical protein [Pseudorhodobacter sp.]